MMKTWVLLMIVYSGGFEGKVSFVPMPTQQGCEDAMAVLSNSIMEAMPEATFHCMETDIPIELIRPKPRPPWLGQHAERR